MRFIPIGIPAEYRKRCPFCGSDRILLGKLTDEETYFCYCMECGASTGGYPNELGAMEAWKKRRGWWWRLWHRNG